MLAVLTNVLCTFYCAFSALLLAVRTQPMFVVSILCCLAVLSAGFEKKNQRLCYDENRAALTKIHSSTLFAPLVYLSSYKYIVIGLLSCARFYAFMWFRRT